MLAASRVLRRILSLLSLFLVFSQIFIKYFLLFMKKAQDFFGPLDSDPDSLFMS